MVAAGVAVPGSGSECVRVSPPGTPLGCARLTCKAIGSDAGPPRLTFPAEPWGRVKGWSPSPPPSKHPSLPRGIFCWGESERASESERQPINSAQLPPPSFLPSCSFKKLQSQECGIHLPIPRRQMWLQMLHGTLPSLKPFLQHWNQNGEPRTWGALKENCAPPDTPEENGFKTPLQLCLVCTSCGSPPLSPVPCTFSTPEL